MRVLVVDDHPKLRANVRAFLRIAGIDSDEAITGQEALLKCREYPYGVIILDLNMPLMDGREFLKTIRESSDHTPVLVLTSDALTVDKVALFELGADDYLTKPFEPDELIARVKALSRRQDKPIESKTQIADLDVDFDRMTISRNGQALDISAKEWGIFEYLIHNRGIPKNKGELLEVVWGEQEETL